MLQLVINYNLNILINIVKIFYAFIFPNKVRIGNKL